jgi:hypothetical protein
MFTGELLGMVTVLRFQKGGHCGLCCEMADGVKVWAHGSHRLMDMTRSVMEFLVSFRIHGAPGCKVSALAEEAPEAGNGPKTKYLAYGPLVEDAGKDGRDPCASSEVTYDPAWRNTISGTNYEVHVGQHAADVVGVVDDIQPVTFDFITDPPTVEPILHGVDFVTPDTLSPKNMPHHVVPQETVGIDK